MPELLMLAKTYNPKKDKITNWLVSEKLDGQRCFWDGGVTRGMLKSEVPWANTAKDERYVNTQVSTGLWSRYGNVVHAPGWWLDKLPTNLLLDGELWSGRGLFQTTRSIISRLDPNDADWETIQYIVFDSPYIQNIFDTRVINNTQYKKRIVYEDCVGLFANVRRRYNSFLMEYDFLKSLGLTVAKQTVLKNEAHLYDMLEEVVDQGGEGLMLRDPSSIWYPKRSNNLLKVKPFDVDVGTVVGYTDGLGKYEGILGALIVHWRNVRFELSGFTDDERASAHSLFPLGSTVRFKYTSLTDAGVPREARYVR